MKENYQTYIESLSDEELFYYLTKNRGEYQKEGIEYAEKTLTNRKLNIIDLQKKYNYNEEIIEQEIVKRILNEEKIEEIVKNFRKRKLEDFIYLIEQKNQLINKKKSWKKIKRRIFYIIILYVIYLIVKEILRVV